jgi:hypothetical protein
MMLLNGCDTTGPTQRCDLFLPGIPLREGQVQQVLSEVDTLH